MKSVRSGIKAIISFALFLLFAPIDPLRAQSPADWPSEHEALIEDHVSENGEDAATGTEWLPEPGSVNVHTADAPAWQSIPFLSDIQIRNILLYRQQYGTFMSPHELLGVTSLSAAEIDRMLPFLSFDDPGKATGPLSNGLLSGKHEVFLRYQQVTEAKRGFESTDGGAAYLGIAPKLYISYRYSKTNTLSVGVTLEQDSGEPFVDPRQKTGFDYLSAHVLLDQRGIVERFIAGDFEVSMGQGLVLHEGYSGATSNRATFKKRNPLLRPHTSANETSYSRGMGVQLALGKKRQWGLMAFASARSADANLKEVPSASAEADTEMVFTSLGSSGLHRTDAELADKNALWKIGTGGSLFYSGKSFKLSLHQAYHRFQFPWRPAERPDNRQAFQGASLLNTAVEYSVLYRQGLVYGEVSVSENGGFATLHGCDLMLHGEVRLAFLYRYYASNYQSPFSGAFSTSSKNANEHGCSIRLNMAPSAHTFWESFFDFARFKKMPFNTNGPAYRLKMTSSLTWNIQRNMSLTGGIKHQQSVAGHAVTDWPVLQLKTVKKTSLRGQFKWEPNPVIRLQSRFEMVHEGSSSGDRATGMLFFQDLRLAPAKWPVMFYARYAVFQTDGFSTAIYAYENDLLKTFSVPAYYGQGSRYYLMVKIRTGRHFDFWIRWSQTLRTDAPTIGSGLEEIDGNTRSEIKIQARIKF